MTTIVFDPPLNEGLGNHIKGLTCLAIGLELLFFVSYCWWVLKVVVVHKWFKYTKRIQSHLSKSWIQEMGQALVSRLIHSLSLVWYTTPKPECRCRSKDDMSVETMGTNGTLQTTVHARLSPRHMKETTPYHTIQCLIVRPLGSIPSASTICVCVYHLSVFLMSYICLKWHVGLLY